MIILGINAYHPDASVALIRSGEVIWAGEGDEILTTSNRFLDFCVKTKSIRFN